MSPRSLLSRALVLPAQLACLTGALAQPAPLGPEFQVNTFTMLAQSAPAVASGATGFVVVWETCCAVPSLTSADIVGQRYDVDGTPVGSEFLVNTYTFAESRPAVAVDGTGGFVVAWESFGSGGSDTSSTSVHARRYDATGTPVGDGFQVNTYTTFDQDHAAVAADAAGNFVVVWERGAGFQGGESIHARRYDASGTPLGDEFQVNTSTTGFQARAAVTADAAGNFVVVWESGAFSHDIRGQRFDAGGVPLGAEFQANSDTALSAVLPAVAADATGSFVVVWQTLGSSDGIRGQRYDAAGTPVGTEFAVNSYTTGDHQEPAAVMDEAGNVVVVWSSTRSGGSDIDGTSIQGRRYDAGGVPIGQQFQVNAYTVDGQLRASVAADSAGDFLVVWESVGSNGPDTDESGIVGRRFSPHGVLPGRTATIRPDTLARIVARPTFPDRFTLPTAEPSATGGALRIFDTAATAGDDTYAMPAGGWKGLGNPPGARGWRYKGAATPADPCRTVFLRDRLLKAVCRGSGVDLTPPFAGDVGVELSLGTTDRYCARFGGIDVRNDATITKRRNAPTPAACP